MQHESQQAKIEPLNTSGIEPTWIRALVLPDPVQEQTKGGIILAQVTKDREEMTQTKGTLIAIGGNAFDGMVGNIPDEGDRVYIGKYAGIRLLGADGKEYRMVNGRDIFGIITKE